MSAGEGRGNLPLPAAGMTAALQAHSRAAELPSQFGMLFFRVGGALSKSLAGTAVGEIMEIGGWKTESVAKYYVGTTSSGSKGSVAREHAARATRTRATCHCRLSFRNISQLAHARIDAKKLWVRQPPRAGPVVNDEDSVTS